MVLDRTLHRYQMAVALVGLGLLGFLCGREPPPDPGVYVVFVAMAVLTEAAVIKLPNGVRTSVTFALVFPAMFIFGPPWAAGVYAMGTFLAGALVQKRPILVNGFNSGQFALAVFTGTLAYTLAGGSPLTPTLFPSIMFILGFMVVNHILVSTYYSLFRPGHYRAKEWLESLAWDALNYALKVPLGLLILIAHMEFGFLGTAAVSASILAVASLLRLQTLLSAANSELRTIQKVSQEVMACLDRDKVFRLVADGMREVVGADCCWILMWDENRRLLSTVYVRHSQPEIYEGLSLGLDEGVVGNVARRRKPEIVEDLLKDPRNKPIPDDKTRSLILLPLVVDDRLIGEIVVGKEEPGAFTGDNLRILTILAAQAAVAIENASLYLQTRQLAVTDGLTGLYNYRYFHARLEEEVSRSKRSGAPLSLVYFDLDDFKCVNDMYGHLAGDQILREFADILRKRVRESDIAVRYAGDEFVLLLVGSPKEEAIQVAGRVKREVDARHFLRGHPGHSPVRLRVSFGVASCPDEPCDADLLVRAADNAMYNMKRETSY